MKLLPIFHRCALLAGAALATTAFAQPEQWLQYHTTSEMRGYRWLEITTNPPPNVALPALGSQPYFVRWTTPLDPGGGRWLCFDRTRRSGPHNRLFVDSTGNGRLDDKKPLEAARVDEYSANFDPVKLVFKGEDGPLSYHLVLRFMNYGDGEVRLLASSGCYYAGKVDIGGKKHALALNDGNVNGVFNDLAANPLDCDRVVLDEEESKAQSVTRLLGRLLEVDNQLFQIEVARDGAFVKIKKAANVTLGRVRVPENISEFTAVGENGEFIRTPAKGEFTLPVGQYRVHEWAINRKDAKGAAWKLSGGSFSEFAGFEVKADQPASVDVGEPVLAALTTVETKTGATFSLRLKGRLGETVEIEKGKQRPRAPQLLLASTGSSFRATNTFEYG